MSLCMYICRLCLSVCIDFFSSFVRSVCRYFFISLSFFRPCFLSFVLYVFPSLFVYGCLSFVSVFFSLFCRSLVRSFVISSFRYFVIGYLCVRSLCSLFRSCCLYLFISLCSSFVICFAISLFMSCFLSFVISFAR